MSPQLVPIEVGLLTGGVDKPYAFGLALALASRDVRVDFIGSDDLEGPELRGRPTLNFINLRGSQREDVGLARKVWRVLIYYAGLIRYAGSARPKLLHVLWNNKFEFFDRTLLLLYYRLRRKKITLTVHNVNAGKRDANDSLVNRLTLRIQYHLADHLFVHTEAMKTELIESFGVGREAITVIPFGLNAGAADTSLTCEQARRSLGISSHEKVILFFGHITPYKGLEFLVTAFQDVAARDAGYRLIIAGRPDGGSEPYLDEVRQAIARHPSRGQVIQKIEFVPDAETEVYFKAADVLVLPYTHVYQSGVLILGYRFGLPAIAADVGSFAEDIVEGETGFLCKPSDPIDLARSIHAFFRSDLYGTLERRRQTIRDYAAERYSWDTVSRMTRSVYESLLAID